MMERKLTAAIAGCGSRGQDTYARLLMEMRDRVEIVAAADIDPEKLEGMRALCGLGESQCYPSAEEMLRQPRLADVMLICTPDRCHYAQAKAALLLDYDLLLEKPISPTAGECRELATLARERGQTLAQMSLSWILTRKQVTSVLTGASRPEQITENVGILSAPAFSEEELAQIDRILAGE